MPMMTIKAHPRRRQLLIALPLILVLTTLYLATTDNATIWPIRNTLTYRLERWWSANIGASRPAGLAELHGCVRSDQGAPLPGATVLLSEHDGTVHRATADASGCYRIGDVP